MSSKGHRGGGAIAPASHVGRLPKNGRDMGCLVGRRPTKQPITLLSVGANRQDAMALIEVGILLLKKGRGGHAGGEFFGRFGIGGRIFTSANSTASVLQLYWSTSSPDAPSALPPFSRRAFLQDGAATE